MITAIDRQRVLGLITHEAVDFAHLLERAEIRRGDLYQVLQQLRASGEIVVERVTDDDFTYPVFRRSTLWDAVKTA